MGSRILLASFIAIILWTSPATAQLPALPTFAPIPGLPSLPSLQAGLQSGLQSLFPNFTFPTLPPNLGLPTLSPLFPPVPCVGPTTLREGSCRTSAQCQQVGGVPDGSCAANFGVCCTNTYRCGATVLFNNSYFSSADYPNTTASASLCQLTINKLPLVAQIRLELIDFEIEGPNAAGRCQESAFLIEGANPDFSAPRLCGINNGQHIIIPVEQSTSATINLRFALSAVPAKWLLKVIQLERTNPNIAPAGCLQYHSGLVGNFSSFNYDVQQRLGNGNIDGLMYSVCFRKQSSAYCSIQFEPVFLRLRRSPNYVYPMSAPKRFVPYVAPVVHYNPIKHATKQAKPLIKRPVYKYPIRYMHPHSILAPIRPKYDSPFEQGWSTFPPNGTAVANLPGSAAVTLSPSSNGTTDEGSVAPIADPQPPATIDDLITDPNLPINSTVTVQSCAGQDMIIFPQAEVMCAAVGSRPVTLITEPYNVFVLNQGTIHNKGFQFNWNQVAC